MIVVWRTIGTRPGRYTVRNLQNDMQILAISFHSWPLFDSTCPRLSFLRSTSALPFWLYPFFFLSPRRATSWLVSCIMHAPLLSTVSVGAVSRRTRLRQPAAAFSSRPRGRSFRRRSDTRWTIFADDDASMFHENHEGWRIHFVISIIYAATLPGCLEFFLLLRPYRSPFGILSIGMAPTFLSDLCIVCMAWRCMECCTKRRKSRFREQFTWIFLCRLIFTDSEGYLSMSDVS